MSDIVWVNDTRTLADLVWSKPHLPFGRGHYVARHESCWYLVRNGKTAQWNGEGTQTTSPAYVAVTIQRWADQTGRLPVLTDNNSHA